MEVLKIISFEAYREDKEIIQSINSFGDKVDRFQHIATIERESEKNRILWRGELWDKLIIRYNTFLHTSPFHIEISEPYIQGYEQSETFASKTEVAENVFADEDEEDNTNISKEEIVEDLVTWEMLDREDINFSIMSQDKKVKKKTFKVLEGGKIESK